MPASRRFSPPVKAHEMQHRLYGSISHGAPRRDGIRPLTESEIERWYAAVDQAIYEHGKPSGNREFRELCWQFESRARKPEM